MKQLPYFPRPYPGELFYSLLARYHRHVGSPKMMYTQDALFGRRFINSTYDLPGHLDELVARLPIGTLLLADDIVDSLTLFGYFTAFEPQDLRTETREMMRSGGGNIHIRLGLSAFRVIRILQLQFCPICVQQMLDQYGELYWRRDHQLPGVFVCPLHGNLLLKSNVIPPVRSRYEFIAATPENCPFDALPIIAIQNQGVTKEHWQLARRCSALLNHPPHALTRSAWTDFYQKK